MTDQTGIKAEPSPATYDIKDFTKSEKDVEKIWHMWQTIFPAWPIERQRLEKILLLLPGQHYLHGQGFCLSYLKNGEHGQIAAVGVLPEHRRKGLGTAFMTKAQAELRKAARANGHEDLKSLEIGSLTPRFWVQVPIDFPQEVKDFFIHRGFHKSTEPTLRDLYRDIRGAIAPPEVLEKVAKMNFKFSPWSPELYEECIAKQNANFTWGKAYEATATYGQHHEVLVAFDPDTNAQIGWTLMCSHSAIISDTISFLPLMPSKEKTGLISAVGVDKSARGKGVGLAMMVKAIENMQARGIEGVCIDSVLVRGFYEQLGFETFWEYEGALSGMSTSTADKDLWGVALTELKAEDRHEIEESQLEENKIQSLEDLRRSVEEQKQRCIDKGWIIHKTASGKEIKLRYVLEKICSWISELVRVVDVGVAFDSSGHAAAPWGVIKFLVAGATSNINLFDELAESIESASQLIVRYTVIERLYLRDDLDTTPQLRDHIVQLYVAILSFLAAAKRYFAGGTLKKIGRGLLDSLTKRYSNMREAIDETEVNHWIQLSDASHPRGAGPANQDNGYPALRALTANERRYPPENYALDVQDTVSPPLRDELENSPPGFSGTMGSGKTSLVSKIIQRLPGQGTGIDRAYSVAYFYCSRDAAELERANPDQILSALLKQLSLADSDEIVKPPVAREYKRRKTEADRDESDLTPLDVEVCTKLITEICNDSPAYIVVDALDECDPQRRFELLRSIDDIVSQSKDIVKVFLSSREDVDIMLHIHSSEVIRSRIVPGKNQQDIDKFIEEQVEQLVKEVPLLRPKDRREGLKLKKKTIQTLKSGACGIFRWVALSVERLKPWKTRQDYKKALGSLPPKLFELYDIIYEEMKSSGEYAFKIAQTTLTLLLYSRRLLSIRELIAAVTIDSAMDDESDSSSLPSSLDEGRDSGSESDDRQEDGSYTTDEIVSLCRNFVVIDPEENTFRFAHPSVRDFLVHQPNYHEVDGNSLILSRCLEELIIAPSVENPEAADQGVLSAGKRSPGNAAMLAASYGFKSMMERLTKRDNFDPNGLELQGQERPLHRAAWSGHVSIVQLLLAQGADPNLETEAGMTALDGAILDDREDVVKCLLDDERVDVNRKNGSLGETPLHLAVRQETMVKLLLEHERVDANLDSIQGPPLWVAVRSRLANVVQLFLDTRDSPLLKKKIDVNCRDSTDTTALCCAAEHGYADIVRVLLQSADVDRNSRDRWFEQTPLNLAAMKGHVEVVKVLLGDDLVRPNIPDNETRTPIFNAFANGHEEIVDLLWEHDDVYPMAGLLLFGSSGFSASVMDHDAIEPFVGRGVSRVNFKNRSGKTAMHFTAERGIQTNTNFLLDHGAEADVQDGSGRTPLSYAAGLGQCTSIQQLLAVDKVEPNKRDHLGRSPLCWSVGLDRNAWFKTFEEQVERSRVKQRAKEMDGPSREPEFPDFEWYSESESSETQEAEDEETAEPSEELERSEWLDRCAASIKVLLADSRVEVNLRDNQGRTPLFLAASEGFAEAVKLLLDEGGADPELADDDGETALERAERGQHDEVVSVLKSWSATHAVERIMCRGPNGQGDVSI
ncbi:hypothetical protein AK830_g3350 [Neonectria ditissima]|uniref:N-acetyltransferase domain-containing protein n=1 Tax=Neonectria ditissima TaxID=78410 RepID=A0A0N8H803_9HYPO|nr:hypothetical protein AK830_g3350 [Neonectria ditissima]